MTFKGSLQPECLNGLGWLQNRLSSELTVFSSLHPHCKRHTYTKPIAQPFRPLVAAAMVGLSDNLI